MTSGVLPALPVTAFRWDRAARAWADGTGRTLPGRAPLASLAPGQQYYSRGRLFTVQSVETLPSGHIVVRGKGVT